MKSLLKSLAIVALSLSCFTAYAEDKTDLMMKDHLMMKDGQLMMMKDGKSMAVTKDQTLTTGTVVMKDGTIKEKDAEPKMMKEGDMISMDGKLMTAGMAEKK